MRISFIAASIAIALSTGAAGAQPAKAAPKPATIKELGTWDCNGSKTVEVVVPPGTSVYAWTGECSGEEGHSAIVEPAGNGVEVRQTDDPKTKRLILTIENRTKAAVKRKLHVFVGFA